MLKRPESTHRKTQGAKYAVFAQQAGFAIDIAVEINDGMETWSRIRSRKALKKLLKKRLLSLCGMLVLVNT
jgi:hypothetical protein